MGIVLCTICADSRADIGQPIEQLESGKCEQCGREFPARLFGKEVRVDLDSQPECRSWYLIPLPTKPIPFPPKPE